mgnify:CR=1 FL=1
MLTANRGRKPAHGAYLYAGRKEVGQVTSATWSPVLKRNIALATVDARYAALGTVQQVGPAVVNVSTVRKPEATASNTPAPPGAEGDPLFEFFKRFGVPFEGVPRPSPSMGLGSGFIISANGFEASGDLSMAVLLHGRCR